MTEIPRNEKGQILPGPMSPSLKDAISKGQMERHRRQRREVGDRPDTKRCSKCRAYKAVPEEFSMRKRTLKSGEVVKYPAGECLKCAAIRREAWKQKFIDEHGIDAWRAKVREHNASRKPDARRRYQREYGRIKRIEEGVTPRGPWKKYAHESGGRVGYERLEVGPFLRWWESLSPGHRASVRLDVSLDRVIRKIISGDQDNVELSTVDRAGLLVAEPGLVRRLYP